MRKPLTEREQSTIKMKLLESCRVCWERYGYKKAGVAEIAAMSGISTGSFYTFFPSKEALFAETANDCTKKLLEIMMMSRSKVPTKIDFANGMKQCVDELFANKWIFSLREDAEKILRKLPEGYLEQDFQQDLLDIMVVIEAYRLIPKVSMEEITAVFHTLLMSIYLTEIIGTAHRQALYLLIDSAIDELFE